MSFSNEVKTELCRWALSPKSCARAEAYGVLLFCHSFTDNEVKIVTGCPAFAQRLPELFKRAFRVTFDRKPEGAAQGKETFLITEEGKRAAIGETLGYDPGATLAHHINLALLEEDACRTAFLRGAFLAGGSVSDPAKSYHLELCTSHYSVSRELPALLREVGFEPKQTTRKSNYVTYMKSSETIADFLTALGAPLASMELMNAKLEKHLRGSVNRRVNCDSANLDKAVDAALEQVEAIQRYARTRGLDSLPDKLRETAELRLAHPELTLSQLSVLFQPPITKSALNHRLRKLLDLAGEG
ncbi:DNA-binding protein WhiA [uncultured Intestinimonas sp.]|uniref:DNA-binding protein WhiA n=1 Tax=uncultured Intestinimonas sp. TaxID=1689265 RepID=UPI0025D7C329|nr:DNA-binding protein WhiA [uncultured Intestinimonas sp.]